MRRIYPALLSLFLLAAALPAAAGIHYTSVTTTEGPGTDQRTVAEAWVEGERAKVEFRDAGNPMLEKGTYILTTDGGKTLYLVDPKEKTYAEWDLEAMFEMLGNTMEAVQPMVNLQIENVEVEKLDSGSGPSMVGLSTRYAEYRTTYDMKIKVLGMGRANHVDTVQKIWTTDELGDAALGVWLRKAPTTGFADVDELVKAEMGKIDGFPLKTVSTSTTTGQKKKRSQTTVTTMEVTELERGVSIPDSTFEIPEGYTRTESTLPEEGEGEQDEGGNPFQKIFGGGE